MISSHLKVCMICKIMQIVGLVLKFVFKFAVVKKLALVRCSLKMCI